MRISVRVCHFTSGHDSRDSRVYEKQCRTLSSAGYDVYLVTPDGCAEIRDGVVVMSIPRLPGGRFIRISLKGLFVFQRALRVNADIYQFHDPELLPYGLVLKLLGKKVVFDSHEDTPADIQDKQWIPKFLRNTVSVIYAALERFCCRRFDAVFCVTPHIVDRIRKTNSHTLLLTNYPKLPTSIPAADVKRRKIRSAASFCFIGRISPESNHELIVSALARFPRATYTMAGPVSENYLKILKAMPAGEQIVYHGEIDFSENEEFLARHVAGFQLTGYIKNYGGKIGSLGNTKLFTYMINALPVICTDFVLWREIVEKHSCGIAVDASSIDSVSDAIDRIMSNPTAALEMGESGRRAVFQEYNWTSQEPTLLSEYSRISASVIRSNARAKRG